MRIRTTEKLSENRETTPEGYLLCKGASLARTGVMQYLAEEVESALMEGTDSETALLLRDEKDVFDPVAMASFEGKPLTIDHPDCDVDPENWQELARGMVINIRRGEGKESDLLLGDILVTDAEAIELINEGECELSCGYDTKLEVVKPGVGRQTEIRGNHVALVEHGRAGKRCRIKDGEEEMAKKAKGKSLFDKLRKFINDAEAQENTDSEEEKETPQTATDEVDIAAEIQEVKLMVQTILEIVKPAEKAQTDSEPETRDEDSCQDEGSGQEETTKDDDPAQDDEPKRDEEQKTTTRDSLPGKFCDSITVSAAKRLGLAGARLGDPADPVRRAALGIAMRDADTAKICRDILDAPLAKASSQSVRAAFLAVSAIRGNKSNGRTVDALAQPGAGAAMPVTPAKINELNQKFYGGK